MNTQSHFPPPDSQPVSGKGVIVGIDWADREHVVCLIDPHGRATVDTLPQSPEAIDEWATQLATRFPGQVIAIAIEQSKGAIVYALLKYEHLQLYPINPKQLARYREAMTPSGSKGDPTDARLLARISSTPPGARCKPQAGHRSHPENRQFGGTSPENRQRAHPRDTPA